MEDNKVKDEIEKIRGRINTYKSVSREHQFIQVENAEKYAEIFYRTFFLFNTGAFVILPTYRQFFEQDGNAMPFYTFMNIMIGFLTSAFLGFVSLLFAYSSSMYGAKYEVAKASCLASQEWETFLCDFIKDLRAGMMQVEKTIELAGEQKEYLKKSIFYGRFAVVLALLALFVFFIGAYCSIYFSLI